MIKLHGVPISNCYSMVKLALLEKGFEFEEVAVPPSQEPDFLEKSPMGKIPVLEADEGFVSESSAILEFLEEIHPEIPLYPEAHFERARVRELMKICELYVDLPARRLLPGVFFGATLSDEKVSEVRPALERGIAALTSRAVFAPYLTGAEFTAADIVGHYALGLARSIADAVYQWDILAENTKLAAWDAEVSARPFVQEVDTGWQQAIQAFRESHT